MMRILLLMLLAGLLPVSLDAVDFTPRYHEETGPSGQPFRRLYFGDHDQRYTLSAPPGLDMEGSSRKLTFTFNELEGATLSFQPSPLKPGVAFSEEAYRKAVRDFVPPGVTGVSIIEEEANPLATAPEGSYRFVLTCQLPGNSVRMEVLFLNLNKDEQIAIVTTAYSHIFKEAAEQASALIRSWRPVTLDELRQPLSS